MATWSRTLSNAWDKAVEDEDAEDIAVNCFWVALFTVWDSTSETGEGIRKATMFNKKSGRKALMIHHGTEEIAEKVAQKAYQFAESQTTRRH